MNTINHTIGSSYNVLNVKNSTGVITNHSAPKTSLGNTNARKAGANNEPASSAYTNKNIKKVHSMISEMEKETRGDNSPRQGLALKLKETSILDDTKKYSESLRSGRIKSKDTSLQLKKLKYQFKNLSSKILRSKTSNAAKQAASQARREALRLKREKEQGGYDNEEIDAAIAHAKAMERVAKKKAKHLEEEEMAKTGGVCLGSKVEDEIENEEYEDEEYEYEEYEGDDEVDITERTENEILSSIGNMATDMFEELADGMKELLEDLGFEELTEELTVSEKDMDPEDLKMMKIKHRNKEMKDMVKADAEYLKAVFDHLQKMKEAGGAPVKLSGNSAPVMSGNITVPAVSHEGVPQVSLGMEGAGIDISL
ncbi:MAG: hypothetical protein MJZ11_02100 [Lachnospiraceae bacterium]|nr:hypothetical protein [Lachnospiraceae bacterium]